MRPARAFLVGPFFSKPSELFVLRRAPKQTGRRFFVKLRKGKERGASRFVAPALGERKKEQRRKEGGKGSGTEGARNGGGAESEKKGKQADKSVKTQSTSRCEGRDVFAGSSAPKTAGLGRKPGGTSRPALLSPFFEGGGRRGRAEASGSGKGMKKKSKKAPIRRLFFLQPPQSGKPFRTYPRSAHRTAAIGSRLPPDRSNPSKSCCA